MEFAAESNGSLQKRLMMANRMENQLREEKALMESRLKAGVADPPRPCAFHTSRVGSLLRWGLWQAVLDSASRYWRGLDGPKELQLDALTEVFTSCHGRCG